MTAKLRQPKQSKLQNHSRFLWRQSLFWQLRQPKQSKLQNHSTFLWTIWKIWVGSSTQATQTVEATKPQHISLDNKTNLSCLLNQPRQTNHKTTLIFSGDKVNFDNSGNPNSQSYRTTPNFSGRYKEFELSTQHRQPKPSKPKNHIIRKPQTKPYFSDDKAVFTF